MCYEPKKRTERRNGHCDAGLRHKGFFAHQNPTNERARFWVALAGSQGLVQCFSNSNLSNAIANLRGRLNSQGSCMRSKNAAWRD
jgi:hypothetical protein